MLHFIVTVLASPRSPPCFSYLPGEAEGLMFQVVVSVQRQGSLARDVLCQDFAPRRKGQNLQVFPWNSWKTHGIWVYIIVSGKSEKAIFLAAESSELTQRWQTFSHGSLPVLILCSWVWVYGSYLRKLRELKQQPLLGNHLRMQLFGHVSSSQCWKP